MTTGGTGGTLFKGKDREYIQWTRDHPEGWVLHDLGKGDWSIHRSACEHIFDLSVGSLTGRAKRCSDDRSELVSFVRSAGHPSPVGCSDC